MTVAAFVLALVAIIGEIALVLAVRRRLSFTVEMHPDD